MHLCFYLFYSHILFRLFESKVTKWLWKSACKCACYRPIPDHFSCHLLRRPIAILIHAQHLFWQTLKRFVVDFAHAYPQITKFIYKHYTNNQGVDHSKRMLNLFFYIRAMERLKNWLSFSYSNVKQAKKIKIYYKVLWSKRRSMEHG